MGLRKHPLPLLPSLPNPNPTSISPNLVASKVSHVIRRLAGLKPVLFPIFLLTSQLASPSSPLSLSSSLPARVYLSGFQRSA